MKSFEKLIAVVVLTFVLVCAAVNILLLKQSAGADNFYKVEISRIENEIANVNDIVLNGYETILGIYENDGDLDFLGSQNKYIILTN